MTRRLRALRLLVLVGSSTSCVANLGEAPEDAATGGFTSGSGASDAGPWSGGASATGGASAGGTSSSSGGASGAVTYAMAAQVIDSSCSLSICHGERQEPIFRDDSALPEWLFTTVVEACGNAPIVTPGDVSRSALVLLVERKCGDLVMPDECRRDPCLPPADLALLRAWIEQGAPRP